MQMKLLLFWDKIKLNYTKNNDKSLIKIPW